MIDNNKWKITPQPSGTAGLFPLPIVEYNGIEITIFDFKIQQSPPVAILTIHVPKENIDWNTELFLPQKHI